jgi:light-regulated signal transduction histidine kinase (bacteriophytochrome)
MIGIIQDVTRQKLAEEALRETDRRKDEFLATLAHELRNPLAPIRQATLIAQSPNATDAQRNWSHEVIIRQVHNMALLLDDLLDISRITRGTLALRTQLTDLSSIVDAAVETARPLIDAKRHVLTVQLPTERVEFAADPMRLAQVLSNLLTNAAKYTDPDGRVGVSATCENGAIVLSGRIRASAFRLLPWEAFSPCSRRSNQARTVRRADWASDLRLRRVSSSCMVAPSKRAALAPSAAASSSFDCQFAHSNCAGRKSQFDPVRRESCDDAY